MNNVGVFSFQDGQQVRAIMISGEPWFVAKDVCDALGLRNSRKAIGMLDDDEKGVTSSYTPGGMQAVNVINESGLYTLILRCRDAVTPGTVSYRFRKWVTGEVLPSIRKNGIYAMPTVSKPKGEPLTWQDDNALTGVVGLIASGFKYQLRWRTAIWRALRKACGNPSPAPITVEDMPAILLELRRIISIVEMMKGNIDEYENAVLHKAIRRGGNLVPKTWTNGDELNTNKDLPAYLELALKALERFESRVGIEKCGHGHT